MLPTATLRVLLVTPLLLVAAGFLGIGASILVRGRPLLLRGPLITWALFAIWAPLALAVVVIAASVRELATTFLAVFQVGIAAAVILAARRAMRGYLVIGISEDVFREALQSALARLGLPFEETVVGFKLTSLHEMLRTSLAPRLGSAQFMMESNERPEALDQIAERVEEFLRVSGPPPATAAAFLYGAVGLLALVLAIYQAGRV